MRVKLYLLLILISACKIGSSSWNIWEGIMNIWNSLGSIEKNVKVLFSSNLYTTYEYKLEDMADIFHNPEFDQQRPTVVYIHGYLGNGEFDEDVMAVRNAYRESHNENFIAINWSTFSHLTVGVPFFNNIRKLRLICEEIALQLEKIRNQGCSCYKNFYLVGHSLGGQCAGLIGRHLKNISNNQFVIPRIYALDPAGPDFETILIIHLHKSFDCISRNDADYVQIIHTNGDRYGMAKSAGHADFYPNGGMSQPRCEDDSCSHQFAWIIYQRSVKGDGGFLARKCDSYENFKNGNCDLNEISFMGYSSNGTQPMGTYFLRTHSNKYGPALGKEGLKVTNSSLLLGDGRNPNNTERNYGGLLSIDFDNRYSRNKIMQQRFQDENSSE